MTIAQTILGSVSDQDGNPLSFSSVYIEEIQKGTSVDFEGNFEIKINQTGTFNIVFSYIGYKSEKRTITFINESAREVLNIQLKEESSYLEEAIVTGYSVDRRRDLTGTIVKIDAKDITDIPTPSFEAALQGKAAGVQITQGSGMAGSSSVVRIRGVASISAGGDPLYVLDGIPVTQDYFIKGNSGGMNNNPLATLNPNDIESIEILKDAAATGIYGSRGANGVILITTKKANKKGISYDFTSRIGFSSPTALPRMTDTDSYLLLYQEAWENDGNVGLAPLPGGISWEDAINNNTNWINETVGIGVKNAYSYSVKYKNEDFNIYSNISYDINDSYLVGNSYERLSGRLNCDYKYSDRLTISGNLSRSIGTNNRIDGAWSGGLGEAMSTALPIYPVFINDSSYFQGASNPVRTRDLKQWTNIERRDIYNLSAIYRINDKMYLKGSASQDLMNFQEDIYIPQLLNPFFNHAGQASRYNTRIENQNINLISGYSDNDIFNNKYSFLVGYEYQKSQNQYSSISTNNVLGPINQVSDLDTTIELSTPSSRYAFLSYFTRGKYNIKDKFYLQGTMRVDGSSRFGSNNIYGYFPSASFAYILSEKVALH